MAIPSSGPISLDDLQTEFGGINPISITEYYRGGAYVANNATNSGVPLSGAISLGDFYGAAASQSRTTTTTWNTTTSWIDYYTTSWGGSYTTSWGTSRNTNTTKNRSTSRSTTTSWNTTETTGPFYNNQQFWQVQAYYQAYGGATWADIYWNGIIGQNLSAGITSYTSGGYTYYRGSTAATGYITDQQFTLGTYANYYVSRTHSTSTSRNTTTSWTTSWSASTTTSWTTSRTTSSGNSRTTSTTYSRSTQYSRNTTTTW